MFEMHCKLKKSLKETSSIYKLYIRMYSDILLRGNGCLCFQLCILFYHLILFTFFGGLVGA